MNSTAPAKSAMSSGEVVVMKFGGSSLESDELRRIAVQHVKAAVAAGRRPAVVVSAMGRSPAPYATDSLLALAPGGDGVNRDLLLSCGETISAGIFAALLESDGIAALALTGAQAGIGTDAQHGDAHIAAVDPTAVVAQLDAGVVPVIAGFQGMAADGSVTTLGRGGSDLSAVALAQALGNVRCEIFTDVDGVMTADPKRVSDAHRVGALTFEELSELAANGAGVVHDRAARLAYEAHIPYAVRGIRSGAGTNVTGEREIEPSRPVSGIASVGGHTFLHVVPEAAAMPGGWEREVFRAFAEANINLDCINVNRAGVFFTVRDPDLERTRKILDAMPVAARATRDCAKVSIVGAGMRGRPGVMFAVVQALVDAGVPIIHSTDSNITISILVPGVLAPTAEAALHKHFDL